MQFPYAVPAYIMLRGGTIALIVAMVLLMLLAGVCVIGLRRKAQPKTQDKHTGG